jgi:hypothetical protein
VTREARDAAVLVLAASTMLIGALLFVYLAAPVRTHWPFPGPLAAGWLVAAALSPRVRAVALAAPVMHALTPPPAAALPLVVAIGVLAVAVAFTRATSFRAGVAVLAVVVHAVVA